MSRGDRTDRSIPFPPHRRVTSGIRTVIHKDSTIRIARPWHGVIMSRKLSTGLSEGYGSAHEAPTTSTWALTWRHDGHVHYDPLAVPWREESA